jgi:hypothetical protein
MLFAKSRCSSNARDFMKKQNPSLYVPFVSIALLVSPSAFIPCLIVLRSLASVSEANCPWV